MEEGARDTGNNQKEAEEAKALVVQRPKRYKTLARRKGREKRKKKEEKPKGSKEEKVKGARPPRKYEDLKYRQIRCNMLAFDEEFSKACKHLSEDKQILKDELMKTPFWKLISIYDQCLVSKSTAQKSDKEIQRLIECYVPKLKKFKFGDKVAEISVVDVEEILGLENPENGIIVPNPIEDTRKPTDHPLVQAFFKDEKRITKSRIVECLEAEVKARPDGWPLRVTQLLLLHLFATLLFANSGSTLGWSFIKCITDHATMKKYMWAKGVRDYLLSCLNTQEDGKAHTTSGCVVLIPYWICERSTILCEIDGRDGMTPCCVKWSLPAFGNALKKIQVDQIEIDNAKDAATVDDNEVSDEDFVDHQPKSKKRRATTMDQEVGKTTKKAKQRKGTPTVRDTVDDALNDDDFENPAQKNGANACNKVVEKEKRGRKSLRKGVTTKSREAGTTGAFDKSATMQSDEHATVQTEEHATAHTTGPEVSVNSAAVANDKVCYCTCWRARNVWCS